MCGSLSKTMTHDYCVITLVEGFEDKTVMQNPILMYTRDLMCLWLFEFACNISIRSTRLSTHIVLGVNH